MKQNKPTVYLAGPIRNAKNGGEKWREEIKQEYGDEFDFNDPTENINVPAEDIQVVDRFPVGENEVSLFEIVEEDMSMLRESDGVFVGHANVKSVGTPMEVQWAFEHVIPIVIWNREPTGSWLVRKWKRLKAKVFGVEDMSLWYRHRANHISNDKDDAIERLKLLL
jgi:hypothetical protein